jgi:hypothetical protein
MQEKAREERVAGATDSIDHDGTLGLVTNRPEVEPTKLPLQEQ